MGIAKIPYAISTISKALSSNKINASWCLCKYIQAMNGSLDSVAKFFLTQTILNLFSNVITTYR